VYFYELHEGDEEIYSDVLLVRETEMDPDDFFDLVQAVRRRVQDSYEDDTLIEAIAVELEREHGFIFVSDERLAAAVNVSAEESENFLAEIVPDVRDGDDRPRRSRESDDDDDDDDDANDDDDGDEDGDGDEDPDYRAIIADFDPRGPRPN
jgi:hypothetical protein